MASGGKLGLAPSFTALEAATGLRRPGSVLSGSTRRRVALKDVRPTISCIDTDSDALGSTCCLAAWGVGASSAMATKGNRGLTPTFTAIEAATGHRRLGSVL